MRKVTLLTASMLALGLGGATALAEPFNPVSGYGGPYISPSYGYNGSLTEGRSAYDGSHGWTTGNPILLQFHESGQGR